MDIELFSIPEGFTAADLKNALRPLLQDLAQKCGQRLDFDFLIIINYTTEQVIWDQLTGIDKTYSALLILPYVNLAQWFLKECATGPVTIVHPKGLSKYILKCQEASFQWTQPSEMQQLQKSVFRIRDETQGVPTSVMDCIKGGAWQGSGHVSEVAQVQCGWFSDDNIFNATATFKPVDPLDKLSWYEDLGMPKKLEVGISFEPGKNKQSWTGQWIDFHLEELDRILVIVTDNNPQSITEIYLFMKKPPRFYCRAVPAPTILSPAKEAPLTLSEASNSSSNKLIEILEDPVLAGPHEHDESIPRDYRVSGISPGYGWQFEHSRVYRIVFKYTNDLRRPPFITHLSTILPEQMLFQVKKIDVNASGDPGALCADVTAFEDQLIKLHNNFFDVALSQRLHRLVLNGHLTPSQFRQGLPVLLAALDKFAVRGDQVLFLNEMAKRLEPKAHIRAANRIVQPEADPVTIKMVIDQYFKEIGDPNIKSMGYREPETAPLRLNVYPSHFELTEGGKYDSTRILRRYKGCLSNFLHVCFLDNNETNLKVEFEVSIERLIKERYVGCLKMGIMIGGLPYQFLAYSNSSLRSNKQVYFFTPSGSTTAETIRENIGDWKHENAPKLMQSPCKWGARLGQAFSATDVGPLLQPGEWKVVEDVKTKDKIYEFTDGVGMISPAFVKEIDRMLRPSVQDCVGAPVAYQIRFAGAKGVVCLTAEEFFNKGPGQNPYKMILRKSMVKFNVPNEELIPLEFEICEASRVFPAPTFNRALLKAFEDICGPGSPQVQRIKDIFFEYLSKRDLENTTLPEFLNGPFNLKSFFNRLKWERVGLNSIKSSFLHHVVLQVLFWEAKRPDPEFKISIPESYSCMGVIDEYQLLGKDEVFVRSGGKTISGNVLIYRNPIIHPGDIQMVKAVTVDELKERLKTLPGNLGETLFSLDNVTVFSQCQEMDRPTQTMLSGGDLDGDLYCIITPESGLVPDTGKMCKAATYETKDPFKLPSGRISTIQDVADFIGTYLQYDCVGVLSTLLLTLSDILPQGLKDPRCIKLSQLISDAVDFPKNGGGVNLDILRLSPEYSPRRHPHFLLEKTRKYSSDPRRHDYESQKLLGVLFNMMTQFYMDLGTADNKALIGALIPINPGKPELTKFISDCLDAARLKFWLAFKSWNKDAYTEAELFNLYIRGPSLRQDSSNYDYNVYVQMKDLFHQCFSYMISECRSAALIKKDEEVYQQVWFLGSRMNTIPYGSRSMMREVPAGFGAMSFALAAMYRKWFNISGL